MKHVWNALFVVILAITVSSLAGFNPVRAVVVKITDHSQNISVGATVNGIGVTGTKRVVAVVQPDCHVCLHDAQEGVYARLSQAPQVVDGRVKLAVVWPQQKSEGMPKFLEDAHMQPTVKVSQPKFVFNATPIIVLLDEHNKIIWSHMGNMDAGLEKDLAKRIS